MTDENKDDNATDHKPKDGYDVRNSININALVTNHDQLLKLNNTHILGNITIDAQLEFDIPYDFTLIATQNIIFKEKSILKLQGEGSVYLKSGIEDLNHKGTVIFEGNEPQVYLDEGYMIVHYNPEHISGKHKFHNPHFYHKHSNKHLQTDEYMLINDVFDLQNIRVFLSGKYALSANIDASLIKNSFTTKEFSPISWAPKQRPFVGGFDGNGFTLSNLDIHCKDYYPNKLFNGCGLFNYVARAEIKNLVIHHCNITGNHYVGALFGGAENTKIYNVIISDCYISGKAVIGVVGGEAENVDFLENQCFNNYLIYREYAGSMLGAGTRINTLVNNKCNIENMPLIGEINSLVEEVNDNYTTGL